VSAEFSTILRSSAKVGSFPLRFGQVLNQNRNPVFQVDAVSAAAGGLLAGCLPQRRQRCQPAGPSQLLRQQAACAQPRRLRAGAWVAACVLPCHTAMDQCHPCPPALPACLQNNDKTSDLLISNEPDFSSLIEVGGCLFK
jgi:hypothetical protein